MKIETHEQAMQAISDYYQSIDQPEPQISDIHVLHSDSSIATIRYKVIDEIKSITHTIKIIGGEPTLLK